MVDREKLNGEWQELIKAGINEQLENYEIFYAATDEKPAAALNLSPVSFSDGVDEREYDELTPKEQEFIKKEMFEIIGFDPIKPEKVGEYQFSSPDENMWKGIARVTINKTKKSNEDMYVHDVMFPDGKEEYLIAPQEYR